MRRFRFSISALMGLILFFGVALAALKHPTAFWARAIDMVTMVVMLSAILGALFCRGSIRAFWAGYALFGWFFLVIWETNGLDSGFFYGTISRRNMYNCFDLFHQDPSEMYGPKNMLADYFMQAFPALITYPIGLIGGSIGYVIAKNNESLPVRS